MSSAKLYVGNLSYTTSESSVKAAFEQYGEVASVNLIADRDTGRPKGFGFVEMATPEAAEAAKQALNGTELDGRTLKVDIAKELQPRTPAERRLRRRLRRRRRSLVTAALSSLEGAPAGGRRPFLFAPTASAGLQEHWPARVDRRALALKS